MSGREQVLFEVEDSAGRVLQVGAEDNGTLSISIFAPGQENTDWSMEFDDTDVADLQITLAAYLHQKHVVT